MVRKYIVPLPSLGSVARRGNDGAVPMVLFLALMILLTGCTAMQPLADNADSLRIELRSGEAIKPGDKVRVVTRDGLSRLLIVTTLDKNTLVGHPEGVERPDAVVSLPIDDIVFMEGKKVSVGKTAAYTSGFTVGTALAAGIAFLIFLATFSL
jgi:hypothetical protein